jgi:peptidoglycan/xylan/chitin deacetylase (PgdA/CDA1 family)
MGYLNQLGFEGIDLDDNELHGLFERLARSEEYETETRQNGHNWELAFASLNRQDEHRSPVIERKLQAWIKAGRLAPAAGVPPRWPDGKRFCLCLTHDVDRVQQYLWRERLRALPLLGTASIQQKAIFYASLAKELTRLILPDRRRNASSLDIFVDAEAEHGFKSTFFFMADPIPEPSWEDPLYRYNDMADFEGRRMPVRKIMQTLHERGWDIGLHGSSRSHLSSDLLQREKSSLQEAIGAEVTAVRQHCLFCDVRRTPRAQAEAGFLSDSTFGSNMQIGFRCGTGLPFPFYDLEHDEELPLIEVPLVIQDTALSRDVAEDGALMLQTCIEVMDRVAEVGGALTILWHNIWEPGSVQEKCYRRILSEASKRNAWGCSLRELDHWWRSRSQLCVEAIEKASK